jgi:hypothetical protein
MIQAQKLIITENKALDALWLIHLTGMSISASGVGWISHSASTIK